MLSQQLRAKRKTAVLFLAAGAIAGMQAAPLANAQALSAQYVPIMQSFAGNGTAGYLGDTGAATAAELSAPWGVAYDASGNLYIADNKNNVIRKVAVGTGTITTVAGGGSSPTTCSGTTDSVGDGCLATSATLNDPEQVAFDPAGDIYISDHGNNRIREINILTGIITTAVGNGTKGSYTVGVAATATPLNGPRSVQIDSAGDIFVANSSQNSVFEVPAASPGLTVLYAGTGKNATTSGDSGLATAATFAGPYSMTIDSSGNLYFVDHTNSVIRKVTASTGLISTVAGISGSTGNSGDGGLATAATLNTPVGAFVDPAGNLYIASNGANTVREVNAQTQIISTIAGNGTAGNTGIGGAAIAAELNADSAVAVSPNGNQLVVSSTSNNTVNAVYLDSSFPSTAVGSSSGSQGMNVEAVSGGTAVSYQLGAGVPADFSVGTVVGCPGAMSAGSLCTAGVTFTPVAPGVRNSRLVLTDSASDGYVLGISGTGLAAAAAFLPGTINGYAGTGAAGSTGDAGAATAATLHGPGGTALDVTGKVYIADTGNNKVRVVSGGVITTVAGTGTAGASGDGAAASSAQLSGPASVSLDAAGDVYIADAGNNKVREVSAATGVISTVAGTGTAGSSGDGGLATGALLNAPAGVVSDSNGDLYIADSGNNKVRKVNVYTGLMTTVAGTGVAGSTGNNVAATAATLTHPDGVALDSNGDLYIADTGSNLVREVINGVITTVAGTGAAGSSGDGSAATGATLSGPTAVAVDAAGDVYIADTGNNKVRMISAATGVITTVTGTGTAGLSGNGGVATAATVQAPAGVTVDAAGNYYIADTGNNRVALVSATVAGLAFGSVNTTTTSAAQAVTLFNTGNQNLLLSGLVVGPSVYKQVTGSSTDCAAAASLAPGASCQVRVTFSPAANGSVPGTVTITDNALHASAATQTISLTGTGITVGAPTSVTASAGSGQTAAPLGAFSVALQALVTDANHNPVSGVSVTFTAPATGASGTFANSTNTVTVATATNGIATATAFTANGTRGGFAVTASVAGVSTPASFTETIAGNVVPALTLSLSAGTIAYGQNETVTLTLTPATVSGTAATGTVTLDDNGTAVGSGTVASGAVSITYAPGAGTRALTASYSGDSNFGGSATASSSSLVVTPLPVTATAASLSLAYGSTVPVISGTLTGVLSKDAANVSVTFAPSSTTRPLPVGVYALTAQSLTGTAAGNYTVTATTGSPTLTITQATTVTTLAASNTQPSLGTSVTLTATVASAVSGAPYPVGTVTFYNGTTSLGPAAVSGSTGTASINVSTLPAGAQTITAVYTGNANTGGSTSAALTVTVVTGDYTITASPATATIEQGDRAYITLTVTGNQAFAGTVSFACSNLPAYAACTFTPASISGSGNALLMIAASGAAVGELRNPLGGTVGTVFAALFLPVLLLGGLTRRNLGKTSRKLLLIFVMLTGLCAAGLVSGCGNSEGSVTTPAGTSTLTINSQSGTLSHSFTFTLTVTPSQ